MKTASFRLKTTKQKITMTTIKFKPGDHVIWTRQSDGKDIPCQVIDVVPYRLYVQGILETINVMVAQENCRHAN